MLDSPSRAWFALGTFSTAGGKPFAGLVLSGERVVPVDTLGALAVHAGCALDTAASVLELLENWERNRPALQGVADALASGRVPPVAPMAMDALTVHPPVAARQLLMSGANYFKHVVELIVDQGPGANPGTEGLSAAQLRQHAEELMTRRRNEGVPYFFVKPTSTLTGAYHPVVLPPEAIKPDWELELAVVIGKAARRVSRDKALEHVAGYTLANDITDRALVFEKGDAKAMGTNWIASKSWPTYLPLGPYIVPAEHAGDPQALRMTLKLNGEVMQDESTSDMLFPVARLIEHLSRNVQLLPGDVICTGSPAGNGTHYNRFLRPGDVMDCTIQGLGAQRTPVVLETT